MPDRSFRFTSARDGFELQGYVWETPAIPSALVTIAHGAAEHALRYERFARALNAANFEVWALDHRGHGNSPGPEGLGDFGAAGFAGIADDIRQLMMLARTERPAAPLALFAHSMGSFAAQRMCIDDARGLDALVLSGSTTLDPRALEGTAPRLDPNRDIPRPRTRYDWLSRDASEVDMYIADPLCGFENRAVKRGWGVSDMAPLIDPQELRQLPGDLPVLLIAGEADPVHRGLEGLRALEQLWRDAGVQRIDRRFYPGARHELLNEQNRDEVTADVIAWLVEVLAVSR